MLEELDSIDWASRGVPNIPEFIRGMTSTDRKTFFKGYNRLEWILAPPEEGANENYDTIAIRKRLETDIALLVIPFLLELLQNEGVIEKSWILGLFQDMSNYVQLDLKTEFHQKQARQVFERIKAESETFQKLRSDPEPSIRTAAEEVIQRLREGELKE